MATDREILKLQQQGALATTDAAAPRTAVAQMHSRAFGPYLKTGTENAATNVAEAPIWSSVRKGKITAFGINPPSNVASDNTDYVVIKFYHRVSGASSGTFVGSWNTHGGAQGALTFGTSHQVIPGNGLVSNSDAITANTGTATLYTWELLKYGAGKAIPAGTVFMMGLEEI